MSNMHYIVWTEGEYADTADTLEEARAAAQEVANERREPAEIHCYMRGANIGALVETVNPQ